MIIPSNAYMITLERVLKTSRCPVCDKEPDGIGSHSHGRIQGSGFYCAEGHVWCPGCAELIPPAIWNQNQWESKPIMKLMWVPVQEEQPSGVP